MHNKQTTTTDQLKRNAFAGLAMLGTVLITAAAVHYLFGLS